MQHPVVIIRHLKERVSKCSLQPLRWREGYHFHWAKPEFSFDATGFLMLALDAPVITPEDGLLGDDKRALIEANHPELGPVTRRPILLPDSTWALLPKLMTKVYGEPIRRSLPAGIQTAYPRVSKETEDPKAGLASVEALYLALRLLGEDDPTLLDEYRWRDAFLEKLPAGI